MWVVRRQSGQGIELKVRSSLRYWAVVPGLIKGALIFAIPVIAYGSGFLVFAAIGDAGEVETQLKDPRHAIKHRTTLWKRPLGYTVVDVKEFLSALNDQGCAQAVPNRCAPTCCFRFSMEPVTPSLHGLVPVAGTLVLLSPGCSPRVR